MKKFFEYTNYRSLLKDLFKHKKATDSQFSQKSLMIDLGVRSSGFLSNVLSGKKNLNPAQTEKLVQILNFSKAEGRYFSALVGFDQARNSADKQSYYELIKDIQSSKFKNLQGIQLDLFSRWYFVAIRELLTIMDFSTNIKELCHSLLPSITIKEAQEAIYFLENAGFIQRNKQGIYKNVDPLVSSQNEIKSSSVVAFQLKMIDVAKETLITMPTSLRDISSITFCASEEIFNKIKKETQEFRKHLLELAESDTSNASKVYQLNMQLFPITNEVSRD